MFVSAAAHDLRTPIAALFNYTEVTACMHACMHDRLLMSFCEQTLLGISTKTNHRHKQFVETLQAMKSGCQIALHVSENLLNASRCAP